MTWVHRTAAITGARAYLGSVIRRSLTGSGWHTISLVRAPIEADGEARHSDLAAPSYDVLLADVDTRIHCADDPTLTTRSEIVGVNVEGTGRWLRATVAAGVARFIALSRMSPSLAITETYGQAQLPIEAVTLGAGGCVLHPGLRYGDRGGRMAAALRTLARLPLVPISIGRIRQFTVHEDDFAAVVTAVAEAATAPVHPIGVAHPHRVEFHDPRSTFASWDAQTCHFIPLPWQPMYWSSRFAELVPVALPYRAEARLGLVHRSPSVPGETELKALGVPIRELSVSTRRSR